MINVIIAGSRDFTDEKFLFSKASAWAGFDRVEYRAHNDLFPGKFTVICGDARGADALGAKWAEFHGIEVTHMPAKWRLESGLTDRGAGHKRNAEMAAIGDVLLAFWDGKSKGTKGMIDRALKVGLEVHVFRV